jgi:hypothetical protein
MSKTQLAGVGGIVLVGIYSVIMMTTSGAAPYAWLILAAGIALVVTAGRRVAAGKNDGQDG